jgi:CDP-diacylglycerol--glycerol-3-phosphate 3-phosphatidyltransferase
MTLTTQITVSRFVIAALLIPFFYQETSLGYFVTALLFVVAIFTDWLDGYVARKFNQTSSLGAVLDALADKILIYTLLFSLFHVGVYGPFLLFSMFFRDMLVDALRNSVHCRYGTAQSNIWGKIKFGLQSASALFGLAYCFDKNFAECLPLANAMLSAALVVSLPGVWIIAMATREISAQMGSATVMLPHSQ